MYKLALFDTIFYKAASANLSKTLVEIEQILHINKREKSLFVGAKIPAENNKERGDSLSFEAIKTIAEVEATAQRIREEAVKQAKDLIEEAGAQKEKLQAEAVKLAEGANGKALEEAKKLGEAEAAKQSEADAAALSELRKGAEAKLSKAVDLIVERIVKN